jgi:ATP-dependent Clp protease protease subunit
MIKYLNVDPRIKVKATDLLLEPVVVRVNKFNEESVEKFVEGMAKAHETGQEIIPVIVDSYGGQVYSLLSMISEIQSSKLPVATIVESKAMSAGAILFSFGTEGHRYCAPNATLMIHEVSSFQFGKVEELKVDAEETDRLNTLIFKLMAKNCGKDDDYFLNLNASINQEKEGFVPS